MRLRHLIASVLVPVLSISVETPAFQHSGERTGLLTTITTASVSAIAADRENRVYLVGSTGSYNFPTTANALKRTCDRPCYSDAVVARIGDDGEFEYGTYLGGSSNETALAVAVDDLGNVYVGGTTWSSDFPVTRALAAAPNQPQQQGFVAKLSPGGRLLFSVTLGTTGVSSLAIDETHAVYVAGSAHRTGVPLPMVHPLQPVIRGDSDAFVAKLSPDGDAIVFSTYLGGSASDVASAVAVDADGNMFLGGRTSSQDFPEVRPQVSRRGGVSDAFIARIAADGSVLSFSSTLGGSDNDAVTALAVDSDGTAYVSGPTQSADFPVTEGAADTTCGSDGRCDLHESRGKGPPAIVPYLDTFVAAFSSDGTLRFSSFVGGAKYDEPGALAVGPDGHVIVAGYSTSPDFAPAGYDCASDLDCSPFIARVSRDGESITKVQRIPHVSSYAPWFGHLPLAVRADGVILTAVARSGATALIRTPF